MDNFDLKKYLVENKVTTNSRMINENEEDFSVELLVPKIYFNVETGELAETPAAFGARSELKNMDITNYSDGEELIEWVFDGSLEKAKYFEKEYPGLFKVVGGSKMMNEVEAPESITVKLTDKGKNEFNLYTTPGAVKMFPNVFYNFGNTNFELLLTKPMQFQILLAIYYPDIKEIQISTIRPATNKEELNYDEVGELMRARQFNSLKIRGKELNLVPQAYCKFENGFEKGMKDHRGYFEIL